MKEKPSQRRQMCRQPDSSDGAGKKEFYKMANFEKEMSFELVASDGTYTIGYIDEKPAEWDGNTVEPTVGMEFRMKSDGDTFGVNSQDEYIVENERWVENTVPLRMINRFPWETIVYYMDDDIREQVHSELAPCSTEEFLVRYMELHEEKFGEEFQVN